MNRPPPARPEVRVVVHLRPNRVRLPLSARQRHVLDALVGFVTAHGRPPSVRELADAADLASTATVTHHLQALHAAGYIHRTPGRPAAITILDAEDTQPATTYPGLVAHVTDRLTEAGWPPPGTTTATDIAQLVVDAVLVRLLAGDAAHPARSSPADTPSGGTA